MGKKHIAYAAAGGIGLLLLYFAILGFLNSPSHAVETFFAELPWLAALSAGFGLQVGVYSYMRSAAKLSAAPTASLSATGGVSATTMAACCLHHVSDMLPVLGLSAAAVFAARYQTEFIMIGILSNIAGLNMLLLMMKKHSLYDERGRVLPCIMRLNLGMVLAFFMVFGVSLIFLMAGSSIFSGSGSTESGNAWQYPDTGSAALSAIPRQFASKTSEGAVSVDIAPKKFEAGRFYFDIGVNTHSVDLSGFDLKEITVLEAGGIRFLPVSAPELSGHHNNGVMVFETGEEFKKFAIKITGLADVKERMFGWP